MASGKRREGRPTVLMHPDDAEARLVDASYASVIANEFAEATTSMYQAALIDLDAKWRVFGGAAKSETR